MFVCARCNRRVEWTLFFLFALRFELPTRPVCAPSGAALNGKHQQPLTVRCRPDKLVLKDKAEQLRSTTELHNTNANIQTVGLYQDVYH